MTIGEIEVCKFVIMCKFNQEISRFPETSLSKSDSNFEFELNLFPNSRIFPIVLV